MAEASADVASSIFTLKVFSNIRYRAIVDIAALQSVIDASKDKYAAKLNDISTTSQNSCRVKFYSQ